MSATAGERTGIFAFVRRILDGGLALVENRVELVAVEFREEKRRLVETVILAAVVIACGLMTITLATLLVVIFFWENARLGALGGLSAFYLAATIVAWRSLRARLNKLPFSATLHELERDRARIEKQLADM